MNAELSHLRIALAHDWILGISGTERVLQALHELFPEAPIYTLLYNSAFTREFLPHADIRGSILQPAYQKGLSHKLLGPLLPTAVESFDLSEYDIVLSSAFAYTKGLILKPHTLHINYCHSPTRQLWDWHSEYRKETQRVPKSIALLSQHIGRIWDYAASLRTEHYIANSYAVAQRIKKYYRRNSQVIYPPVSIPSAQGLDTHAPAKNYFLIVSRLFKHKNIEVAVQTFNKTGWNLVVIGDGPERTHLENIAESNIQFLGSQPDAVMRRYYQHCKAFIMPQEEDFGITAIEAMSYGKPVLALRRGGALEYIEEGINGEFFDDPIEEVLAYGVKRINDNLHNYNPDRIKEGVQRFSKERFQQEIKDFIISKITIKQ